MKGLNNYVTIYKEQLEKGDIQKAYTGLMKVLSNIKNVLSKEMSYDFSFGNVSPGYMDYSYFPFLNNYLRNNKLRFGIVLNHEKVRFELWLMGQNEEIQNKYWNILKSTKWNEDKTIRPKYSILETVILEKPDFSDLDKLNNQIRKITIIITNEIIDYLKKTPDQ